MDQIRQIAFAQNAALKATVERESQTIAPSGDYIENKHGFQINTFKTDGTAPSLTNMESWMTGVPAGSEVRSYINLSDPGDGGKSPYFTDTQTFPGLSATGGNDRFVLQAMGAVEIPVGGVYTFGVVTDDGYRLKIDGETVSEYGGVANDFVPIFFEDAGWYNFEFDFYENTGSAYAQLFAAVGDYAAWADTDTWALVGGDGGLRVVAPGYVPEPSTWALLILGAFGLVWFRRKK